MNRTGFTNAISLLLREMIEQGESPIIDYVKRSSTEQKHLFDLGLSKCDGFKKLSLHQSGMAIDIFFQDIGDIDKDGITKELIEPLKGWEYWHKEAESLGLKPMILWDKNHFEG